MVFSLSEENEGIMQSENSAKLTFTRSEKRFIWKKTKTREKHRYISVSMPTRKVGKKFPKLKVTHIHHSRLVS